MNTIALPDLATAIEAEHHAARQAARTAIEHAIACGKLLIEAKADVGHGGWLPWVEANLSFGDRQARKYMRVAANAELLANRNCGADLSINAALELLSEQVEAVEDLRLAETVLTVNESGEPCAENGGDFEFDPWAWAERQVTGPFNAWDFAPEREGWLEGVESKLRRQIGIPAVTDFCLGFADEYALPTLRMCPYDELIEALRLVVPFAKGEATVRIDVEPMKIGSLELPGLSLFSQRNLLIVLELAAQRMAGLLFNEIEHRSKVTEERLDREAARTRERLMTGIEAKLDEVRSRRPAYECASGAGDSPPAATY